MPATTMGPSSGLAGRAEIFIHIVVSLIPGQCVCLVDVLVSARDITLGK